MDRISYLPDPIRGHIISHLPLEDALRTSILSTRWRHICSSLSNLNFDQYVFECKTGRKYDFKDFVYQTLVRHDGSDVDKFELTVDFDDSHAQHLHSWVSFAVRHNVKEFDICMTGELESLPNVLFTCKTLTMLRMDGIVVNTLPAFFVFPMLKKISLEGVTFVDANQTNQLISSSPILQSLTLWGCTWMNTSNPLIFSAHNLEVLDVDLYNVPADLRICTPNLKEIRYSGNPPVISSETLSSLVKAKMTYFSSSLKLTNIASDHMTKIVMGLHNVVSLRLFASCVEFLIRDPDLLSHLPTCCSLKYLDLNIFATNVHTKAAHLLLKSYPNLETVCIRFKPMGLFSSEIKEEGHWQLQELSSESTLNRLKRVRIHLLHGIDCELDLIRHLFEKANTLEDMNIAYSADLAKDVASQKTLHEKLDQFKKASAFAKISYPLFRFNGQNSPAF